MKKYIKTLEYWFDYYFVLIYFLFSGSKIDRYFEYMEKKWGNKK